MQIEVPCRLIPYERLEKLRWSAAPSAYQTLRRLTILLVLLSFAALAGLSVYRDEFDDWMLRSAGISDGGVMASIGVLVLFLLIGQVLLRRIFVRPAKSRENADKRVRLTTDDGGIRIAVDELEYYLKWQGISEMQMARDGVALYGALFVFVPDTAFPDAGTRLAFIRKVYGHLGEKARSISEKHLRLLLDRGS